MKKTLLGAAVVVALSGGSAFAADAARPIFTPPPPAPNPLSGYLEVYGSAAWQGDYWGTDYDPWTGLGGAGRVNWMTGPNMSIQLDFAAQGEQEPADYYHADFIETALHISNRNDRRLFGAFLGLTMTSEYYNYGWDYAGMVGVEAQHYMGNVTVYGQVGYQKMFRGYYDGADNFGFFFAQLEGRFFIGQNTKLAANVGVVSGDLWDAYPITAITFGAEVEHKMMSGPLSVFARLDGFTTSSQSQNLTEYSVKGGVKLHLGQATLLDQDRKGATLKVMDPAVPAWLRLLNY
jgi:hypothetical protein